MSHVFLAEDVVLGRKVVVKVLPPEMAAGVNVERFRREIQLAASLQHPHIVPVLTAGASGDLLYYVMPYVEGESLRARIGREGELPIGETVRTLADVVDALAYAHAHGVVHRDIKPDNVLISGKHAVVTDFGVAKAMAASSGASSLTSLGVALGTPAYMAPEQAAADPHVDHRADLYAVGALAYEMLCGRPPFTGTTPQAVLAAHVSRAPEPCTTHRPAVPPALNALVMRCLEKHASDRWQNAEELGHQLEAMATPSGGMAPTGAVPPTSSGTEAAIRRAHPARVVALFGAGSLVVLAVVYVLMLKLGLPDWVFAGGVALLVVGLPIMVVTGLVERRRAIARTTGAVLPGTGLRAWLTWRKALAGGGLAFATLALGAVVYMTMRGLGIGPVGTLVASGVIKNREPVILANFENRASDSTLGPSLTEAFRVDLSQSPTVRVLDPSAISDALKRMERPATAPLDLALARDIAQREGVKAIVTGQIDPVGRSYVLSASVMSASDGRVLTSVRENASEDGALIGAIDKLSRKLRERIGESLVAIRANEPLERVTTGSLEALRKYSQALIAIDRDGDDERGIALLREATTLDTGFAMAYRKLWAVLGNSGAPFTQVSAVTRHAYVNRDRLPELERHLVNATYYEDLDYDPPRIISAYRSVLEGDPDNLVALNNLALIYNNQHQWPQAESLAVRATRLEVSAPQYNNAVQAMVAQGDWAEATALVEKLARSGPGQLAMARFLRVRLAGARLDYPAAMAELDQLAQDQRAVRLWQKRIGNARAALAEVQGRLALAADIDRQAMALAEQRAIPADYLTVAIRLAWRDLRYRNRPTAALQILNAALAKHPWNSLDALDRPYPGLAELYASAGRADLAKQLLSEYAALVPDGIRREDPSVHSALGAIAFAEGRLQNAADAYRARFEQDTRGCASCGWYERARVYDRMGQTDSALTLYDRILTTPGIWRMFEDAYRLAPTYRRLGELYEARGDRAKARDYYGRFVDLWRDADPELQPIVADARAALRRLSAEPR
jgi:tetratricopeptide (TPR) repeat protein